jgi:hypothetical protein
VWPRKSSKKKEEAAASKPIETPVIEKPVAAPVAPRYQKPQADLYTVFLVIALLALLIGILFLCLDMNTFDFKFKGGPTPSVTMLSRGGPLVASLFSPLFLP